MAYIVIEDFKAGLDTRKLAAASPAGTLQKLSNGHITRGGEIDKRKTLALTYTLPPAQTFGFAGANGVLFTFGSAAGAAVPAGMTYQQLAHPTGQAMTAVIDVEFFDGKPFVIAAYANGDVLPFYNGARVTDWDAGSGASEAGQHANALLTVKNKMYAIYSSVLGFSSVAAPTSWQTGSGYGIINMSNQSAGSEALTGLGRYQGDMAIFARRNIQIWYVDPDPLQNAQKQVIPGIGTFASKSIVSYGDTDVFFLTDTGVRSLRARDASNQANVNDVGTAVDDEITAWMALQGDTIVQAAAGAVDPIDGRYIISIGTRAYAFSYFPTSRISAWSSYDLGVQITDWVTMDGQLWGRGGDSIYLYGGEDGKSYDGSTVEVTLPYIDGRQVATFKHFTGLDLVCEGEWKVYVNTVVKTPDAESLAAIVNGTTIDGQAIPLVGDSPVIKLRLVNSRPGAAKLSKVIVHYETTDEE